MANVGYGSMNGPRATSALSPFDSQLRILVGAAHRSHSCQNRTFGPQLETALLRASARTKLAGRRHRNRRPLGICFGQPRG
jgi:hypothetical protein